MVHWRPDQKKKEKKDNYTIDNSFIDNRDYVYKMNVEKDEDKDGEYKEDNEEDPKSD